MEELGLELYKGFDEKGNLQKTVNKIEEIEQTVKDENVLRALEIHKRFGERWNCDYEYSSCLGEFHFCFKKEEQPKSERDYTI